MIQLNLTPTQHQTIIDCMTVAEKHMLDNGLNGVAEMIEDLRNEISLDETTGNPDESKCISEKG